MSQKISCQVYLKGEGKKKAEAKKNSRFFFFFLPPRRNVGAYSLQIADPFLPV
jgi:hypothetical protein